MNPMDVLRERRVKLQWARAETIRALSDDEFAALDLVRLNDLELAAAAERYDERGDEAHVIALLDRVLMSDENHELVDYWSVYGTLLTHHVDAKDTANALRVVRRMIWRDTHHHGQTYASDLQRTLAILFMVNGQQEEGIQLLVETIERFPNDGWNALLVADIAKDAGDLDEAVHCYLDALRLGDADGDEELVQRATQGLEETGRLPALLAEGRGRRSRARAKPRKQKRKR